MSTAKPQRTKGKPAQAEATHKHTWGPSTDPDVQHCPGCGSFQRMVCDYPEHAAFGDLLAACEAIQKWLLEKGPLRDDGITHLLFIRANNLVAAAIAKAKPS